MKLKNIILLGICLMLAGATFAQTPNDEKKEAGSASSNSQAGMKARIFEIKHKNAEQLGDAIKGLASRAGTVSWNREIRTITVRDYPENISAIEAAIKRLDVPEQPSQQRRASADFEVQLYLIATSRNPTERGNLPAGLAPVIDQLQETLRYKGYRLITTILNRGAEYGRSEGNGVTDALFPLPADAGKSFYNYSLGTFRRATDEAGKELVQLENFYFSVKTPISYVTDGKTNISYQDAGIKTALSLREGEKVVVGTANLGVSEEAIIVVVSVRKIK